MGVSVICLSYVTYDHVVSHVFMLCDVCMGHGCHVRRCHIRVHCVCVMRLPVPCVSHVSCVTCV